MKKAINKWREMDWVRKVFLLVGLLFIYVAVDSADIFLGIAGVYLIVKSWLNWGCNCGSRYGSCTIKHSHLKSND